MNMKPIVPKPQRCAIYTRKSTEHNLDLAFNSLDAQREAYIKSQAHEGWTLIRNKFDDGGLSGASLERPALQALLDQVRSKKIDIIVVYKVGRLTRSLADFAKLVELFDAHGVSFVSVTQSFNTTSSMGRLTLNVLLSFAQFEREVIGERVRDKIAASKRKGIWVGGPVPLGYHSVGKKLEIVPEDAALVRKIFTDYLRIESIGELAAALEQEGVRPRPRVLAIGAPIAAGRFMVGPLAHLLKNRFYIGEVVYKGEVHTGEHEPILDRDLFEAAQQKLAERAVARRLSRSRSPSMLMGLIFDDRGNPMSPSHANKKGVRYRYYVSQALLQNRKADAGSIVRVPAPDVEALVCKAVRRKSCRTRRSWIASSSSGISNELLSAPRSWSSRSAAVMDRLGLAGRLPCRSPLLRTFPARKGSPMRPQIRRPWMRKRETRFCGRSRGHAAGWTRSSPARRHRSTISRPPKISPSAMSDS
jgi:site-specific DNA recombinase